MRGIETLRQFGIGFDVIGVLTSHSLHRAEELYEFCAALGPSTVGFNVDELEGINRSSSMDNNGFLRNYLISGIPCCVSTSNNALSFARSGKFGRGYQV
ncbi:MAG: hypothetical protein JO022_14565 [Acidobacteriaceae bacterium]|nr:hypothetical protein [Acidobacteriaceae bacterium]